MNRLFCWLFLAAILLHRGYSVPTEPTDEDDDDWDEDEESSEADDDSRIYKNPRNSPSTECPRDEEQATLLGQTCLRKCSSDEDCKSKKKKCLCDGACGMSCIKPDRECPELAEPSLGTVTLSGRHFGGRATYTCPHGYHVVGLQSRLCQADGKWAGQEPACKQNIYCLTPPTIEHARHSALPEQATFDLDNTVQYHCHTGYVTAGFPRAKCLAIDGQASWYGPDIQCEPRSCGQPPDPGHGYHAGECYTFGCRVTYHCNEGYELVGKLERFCQADGSWTPKELPTCVLVTAVQCTPPENPKNGKALYTSTSYNSVVSYECRYGYTLVGESSRRCGADRKWSGQLPTCKEINCGHPGVLYNGWLENIEAGTGLGASIIYRCHPGMLLVGNTSSVCQIDGRWRYGVPECLAPCMVPTISQGTVIPMEVEMDPNITTTFVPPTLSSNTNKVKHGTTLDVMCEDHYEFPISSLAPPTCNNGTWSTIPRCIPARCKGLPKPPKFGMVLAPKTEHGMKARFKCKDGFNLTGPGGKEITNLTEYVLTCSFGNWTGESPMCQEVYCSFPGYIPHGKILLVGNMGLYDYRPYVKKIINNKQIMYDCDKGYVLDTGPPGATCVGGLWRPTELPSCLPGQHPRLRWTRRRRSVEMKLARSKYLLANYRRLQRYVHELRGIDHHRAMSLAGGEPVRQHRSKRSYHDLLERSAAARLFGVHKRQRYSNLRRNHYQQQSTEDTATEEDHQHRRVSRTLSDVIYRQMRQPFQGEQAYARYMEKIKQKYQKYVKNILGHNNIRPINYTLDHGQNLSYGTTDSGNTHASHVTLNSRGFTDSSPLSNEDDHSRHDIQINHDHDNHNHFDSNIFTISRPQYQHRPTQQQQQVYNFNYRPSKKIKVVQPSEYTAKPAFFNNTYHNVHGGDDRGGAMPSAFVHNQYSVLSNHDRAPLRSNLTEMIAKLTAQIVRRKRSADNDGGGGIGGDVPGTGTSGTVQQRVGGRKNGRRNLNATAVSVSVGGASGSSAGSAGIPESSISAAAAVVATETDRDLDELKRGKPKSPCEAIAAKPYMRIDIVREGRDPASEFSAGTLVRVTCAKEYILNLQNPNGTVKCVRGRWKPMIPQCTLLPCTVPSTEHGSYIAMSATDPSLESTKHSSTKLLVAFEEIHNGDIIDFQCDDGYNVQGPNQLKCWHGNWDVNTLPECVPAPCILPNIANAIYQGGYRGGLTIAHGSSVTIQCENPANNLPVPMVCALGALSPPSIHCGTGARRSREEYLAEVEFVSTDQELNGLLNGYAGKINNNANANGFGRVNFETGKDCGSPARVDDALVYRNGDPVAEMESGFQSGTEITFNCISSVAGERTTWKIICEDGAWVGRSLNCANGTCIFRNNEPNVVSFYNDLEIREEVVEFPPGAMIVSRCADIGKFAMTGSGIRSCIHSEWNGQKPTCFGLNQENDYAMEKPPTILFRHQNGPIAQSNDGKLIVYPGTTVHMECLWMRRFGNPKWISHEYRTYPEGWVSDEGRDSTLEYRLSIFHAVENDTGIFTCQTPARHEHSIDIVVREVDCPEIPPRRGLTLSNNDTKLSTRVQLSCANGNSLIGASELLCLPSGNWSAPLPVCESVECGDLPMTASSNRSQPRVAVLSREVGGRAAFSCKLGFGIRGPSESICLPSGEWATPFPTCVEVQCENPGAPANGYAQGSAPYRAGDVVQFNCNPEYMMQGQPIIACQDNGRWSGGLPKCVQACSYPGTAIAGRMSSVKFYYAIGESITFTCDAGLDLRGAKMLKCLRNGKWSNAIPTCVNPDASGHRGGGDGKDHY